MVLHGYRTIYAAGMASLKGRLKVMRNRKEGVCVRRGSFDIHILFFLSPLVIFDFLFFVYRCMQKRH